ncbi:exosortase-dependent surface protein XDP1 [Echinimonas agarilytica]|uniref:Uncharacterized protein n=1 Tax=Echinimonas agarilytica TaxID=1215918 RepID=A0AA41W4Q6_9GAMM|nr:exosortase-dependent surface protein XDP1 [Echinimonas agarilytica]MCM2678708.1 hypothetical protein [Echinimonas agarilytica]
MLKLTTQWILAALLMPIFSMSVHAVSWDMTMTSACHGSDKGVAHDSDGIWCGQGWTDIAFMDDTMSYQARMTGWSDTDGQWWDPEIEQAAFHYYGGHNGWGLVNKDEVEHSPEHAFDNIMGNIPGAQPGDNESHVDFDYVLISFAEHMILDSVIAGYTGSDSDISILSYQGSSNAEDTLLGSAWDELLNKGWVVTGNYNGADQAPTEQDSVFSVDTEHASQYWLVGAYHSIWGDSSSELDVYDDSFKLIGFEASLAPLPSYAVSEPSGVGCFLLASFALLRVQRKNTRR